MSAAYEFHTSRSAQPRAALVAPDQPRLDWQMWFAALRNYRENRGSCVHDAAAAGRNLCLL